MHYDLSIMKKRYEVRGMMEWHPVFNVGRTRIAVSFTGGHLCGGGTTPAVFETDNPVVQAVIENSDAFRSNRIRLAWVEPPISANDKKYIR